MPTLGWSDARRIADWVGGNYAARWERDLPAIREAYPGLVLPVQVGLVPIDPDPDSGLWEFLFLGTGEEPLRGADGMLMMTEESGLVLVLLPGGSFWMGAQSSDPKGRNFDEQAKAYESPVHEVTLYPFFISKYEMTWGQWKRVAGEDTSFIGSSLAPVYRVSWNDCMEWLPRIGAHLPSEAQWEYSARARTYTPWWTGEGHESLEGAANVRPFGTGRVAQVGTLAANAFGLHDVHGNLWEWCLDGYDRRFYENPEASGPNPMAPYVRADLRVHRGGSFGDDAGRARSANRAYRGPSGARDGIGVRPARVITE